MKIAFMLENSQADKNELIYEILKETAEKYGHEVFNYGKFSAEDPNGKTYVQIGFLAALVLNAKAADFVITGCGTGEGVMAVCNSFPNVVCGLVTDPCDGVLFIQVNNGNAISLPLAKGFGWGAEINVRMIFEHLFRTEPGAGYPKEWAQEEKAGKESLNALKAVTHHNFMEILKTVDREFLKETIAGEETQRLLFEHCRNSEIVQFLKEI